MEAFAALKKGGVFMHINELDSFPRFLADPAGAALEERCHAEVARHRRDGRHAHGRELG